MKISKLFVLLLLLVFSGSDAFAQEEKPATQNELDAITARGKMLFEYDVAAWHSTDAVMALSPPAGSIEKYIAQKGSNGWTVAYGKFNEKKDKFIINYEALPGDSPEKFKAVKLAKPKEDTGYLLNAAKAHETAFLDFVNSSPPNRPYNFAVLPTKDGNYFVYALPAQTEAGVFPLGGDVRYTISKDGSKIIEKHQMHKSIITVTTPPKDIEVKMGYHTAIVDEVPEDSCVFHVLTRRFNIPELVVTNKFVYQIAADGSIKYIMPTEAFKNIGKDKSN